jgi:hypothetical protein
VRAIQKKLGALLVGGVPRKGWWWKESKESNIRFNTFIEFSDKVQERKAWDYTNITPPPKLGEMLQNII